MAETIGTDIVTDIIKTLGSGAYKNIKFARDLDTHIKRLQQLKTTVEATLLDARSLDSCTNSQKDALDKLDCALADLDYFLDATAAKAKQKEIMQGNKFIKEVRLFFSKSNQLVSPFRDAHKIKAIREKFESISRDQGLVRDIIPVPSVNKSQMVNAGSLWSNCHILTEVVIGRDKDRDKIVNMLLDDSLSSHPLSVASICGIGGIGKTTLAKYVFNDQRLKSTFDYHIWVPTTPDFDVKKVVLDILATFQNQMPDNLNLVEMYNFFQRAIGGKKLLLVLDNVWDREDLRNKWLDLRRLLEIGANGSKVLITTRNKTVAQVMDCDEQFMLEDLTEEDSWLLFQKIAFTQYQESGVEAVGREILKMCPKVPLVIRSIGGILAGKCAVKEWQAFRDVQLANFSIHGLDIIHTLKLSYNELDKRHKCCVTFCSLFPKPVEVDKDELIRLWISLRCIESSNERQCLEDAAEECILKLASQGFLTLDDDLIMMHDLMHDLMIFIGDFKYKRVEEDEREINERVCHLLVSLKGSQTLFTDVVSSIFKLKKLETLLVLNPKVRFRWPASNMNLKKIPRLRILGLCALGIEKVPSSLGELIALRYLDISGNPITDLPNSITKLVELLTLNVSYCTELRKLPKGINKLMKLRHIKNYDCPAPIPKGVASLTELQTLDDFPIEFSGGFPTEGDCGFAELFIIINRITTKEINIIVTGDANTRSLTANKEEFENECFLESLNLKFQEGSSKGDKMVLETLQPNTNLRTLKIREYKGERLPIWMKDGTHYFENVVHIVLRNLENCRSIGSFGGLLHLKYLAFDGSIRVEYIEEDCCGGTTPYVPLFPSLEELCLTDMPKLKTWYKVLNRESSSDSSVQDNILLAPQLGFPKLKELYVTNVEFVISMTREFRGFSSLEMLQVDNCEDLKAIPDDFPNLSNLKTLMLYNCCMELVERCREPCGEDWHLIKHIRDFEIS